MLTEHLGLRGEITEQAWCSTSTCDGLDITQVFVYTAHYSGG